MNLQVESGKLKESINKILTVIDKRSSRPILSNCLLNLEESKLEILATDLDVSARVRLDVSTSDNGKFCINSKNFSDILRELPSSNLTLSLSNNNLMNLDCNDINYSLLITSPEEYPEISFTGLENAIEFEIKASSLLNIIQKTSYAMSTDETRLFLNGIFFQKYEGKLRAVAIDGHRLAMIDIPIDVPDAEFLASGIIVPRKGIQELKKIAESTDGIVKLTINDSFLIASTGEDYNVSIRLISREYPKYQSVIPAKSNFQAQVNKDALTDAVKRIKILSNETTNGIKFSFRPNLLELSANNDNLGQANEKIEIAFDGDDIDVSINARYILETLNSLEDESVTLEINNSLSPVVIKSNIDKEFLGIIMPLRL